MELSNRIKTVMPVARKAGEMILEFATGEKQIETKSANMDLVTIADKKSEEFIVEQLSKLFPNDAILAEEGAEIDGSSGYRWIIDPLDGTNNFAHDFPLYAVSIGLTDQNDTPILGVVYNPVFNEMFSAANGVGAFLNDKPIFTSDVINISDALIGTGFPYYRADIIEQLMERLTKILLSTGGVRRTGSAALDLCYVACGRLDAYYEEGLKPWDTAAAVAILHEAGGKTAKFDGTSSADIYVPELIATNAFLLKDFLGIMSHLL